MSVPKKLPKIFVFGLDRAGKTFLSNFLITKTIETVYKPTLGFDIKNLTISDFGFQIWDAPGQRGFRKLWSKGYKDADMLMYVVDTADSERFEESRQEFDTVIKNIKDQKLPILFCYHKMDLPEAQANLEKAKKVFVSSLLNRNYKIVLTSIEDDDSLGLIKENFIEQLKKTRFAAGA
jgi:small GTP-binding protein